MSNVPALLCPRCGDEPLVRRGLATGGSAHQCPRCHGTQMWISELSYRSDHDIVTRLWWAADAYPRPGIACALCRQPSLSMVAHEVELDLCRSCFSIWFDADELERLPVRNTLKQQTPTTHIDSDTVGNFLNGDVVEKLSAAKGAVEDLSVIGETAYVLFDLLGGLGDWG